MKHEKLEKSVSYLFLIILISSLIPIAYLGSYNHPTGDDYYYGASTHLVWEETGSIISTVEEACKGVANEYQNWQGTYSAMLLMYLAPNIFGDWFYKLVTVTIISLLTGSIFYLLKSLVIHIFKGSRCLWLLISSALALLCIQTVQFQGESFFWYNGSMYYTGYFAVTLFFFGLVCRYLVKPKRIYLPILALLAVFLGGGNYVSLLPGILIMACITAILFLQKDMGKSGVMGAIMLILVIGLMISAIAPGNQVRQNGMWNIPAREAVTKSLRQGLRYMRAWMGIWWFFIAVILLPFIWKSYENAKFKFRYPLLAVGCMYGIFCSMSCPTFYTMNSTGPARVVAIVYYGFILTSFMAYYYILGYLHRLLSGKIPEFHEKKVKLALLICIPAILLGIQVYTGSAADITTSRAIRLLANGEAAAYDAEYLARLKILQDDSVSDAVLPSFTNRPDMLYVGDFAEDPQQATNKKVAQYFRKNTVYVKY